MARPEYYEKTFTLNGKRYHVYGRTEDEAIEARALKRAEIEGRLKKEKKPSSWTVEAWAREWLSTYKADVAGARWYKDMEGLINNYIVPHIGSRPLSSVKHADIVKMLKSGKGMSESHNHKVLIVVKQIFEAAIDNDLIDKSPVRNVEQVKSAEKTPRRTITDFERDLTVRTANKDLSIGLFYLIMLYCGCRPGEVAALTVKDYDRKEKILHITKAIKADGTLGAPKNTKSIRDVPVPDILCPILDKELKDKKSTDLICTSEQGRTLTKDLRKRLWKKFKRRMELENGAKTWKRHVINPVLPDDLTPYCYRHTYCTDLQDAGVPVTVASRFMGHSSIRITADIYTHHSNESFEDARDKINAANANR